MVNLDRLEAQERTARRAAEIGNYYWYTVRTDAELWHIAETAQEEINRRNAKLDGYATASVNEVREANRLDMEALHAAATVLHARRYDRQAVRRWPSVSNHKETTL